MAKAKKSKSEEPSTESETPASKGAKKPAAKKAAAKSPARPGMPMIDTSLAAQSAARMVANRDRLQNSTAGAGSESSAFKQLKESVNKPAAHGPANFLQSTAPAKKSNQPFAGFNQVGKNQTFGADVNRTGVPRRTGG